MRTLNRIAVCCTVLAVIFAALTLCVVLSSCGGKSAEQELGIATDDLAASMVLEDFYRTVLDGGNYEQVTERLVSVGRRARESGAWSADEAAKEFHDAAYAIAPYCVFCAEQLTHEADDD